MQNKTLIKIIFISLLLQACSFPGVFKINVQQGNIVTEDMLAQLKPGMTKRQVHFVLGTPTLDNLFDDTVENYIYTYQQAGGDTEKQIVKVYYENGNYLRHEGELLDDHPAY